MIFMVSRSRIALGALPGRVRRRLLRAAGNSRKVLGSAPASMTETVGDFVRRHRPVRIRAAEIKPLRAAQPSRIMIIADAPIELADTIERFPAAQIVLVLITGKSPRPVLRLVSSGTGLPDRVSVKLVAETPEIATILRDLPPQQAIIDAVTRTRIKKYALGRFPYYLADGGHYLITGLEDETDRQPRRRGASVASRITAHQLSALIAAEPTLTLYLEVAEVTGGSLMTTKRGQHLVKLYDAEVEPALTARVGDDWGQELARRPGFTYAARSRLAVNDPQYAFRLPSRWPVPDRVLRVHHDVVCAPRQLVVQDSVILPWSFHHPLAARRHARGTTYVNNTVATLPDDFGAADELAGNYFHLDSEFPGHFGHFVTEDLSRLWGWKLAKERYPDCRLLIGIGADAEDLKPFQRTLLAALGIDESDVRTFRAPVRVQTLIGATPQFHNRRYLDPDLSRIWDQLRAVLRPESTMDRAQRIFVTRDRDAHRQCKNADEVEEIFVGQGFKVVRPETMSIPDQIAIFAAAQVIAGYGGSGMLSMIYSDRPGVRIVIGSEHYTASNEYLIASVRGDSYHHFWCPALTKPVDGEWSAEAFHSDFVFDTGKDGDDLRRLLEGL